MSYEPELLEELKQKKFVDLTSIEKCLFTETDWILQNSALQELRTLRTALAERDARIAELEKESEILDRFYQYGVGMFDNVVCNLKDGETYDSYRSIRPFEKALNDYSSLERVKQKARKDYVERYKR